MADNANNSTLYFGTTITKVKSINYKAGGAKIDVTALTDAQKLYLAGLPDKELTFETVGVTSLTIGNTGAVSVAWADGSTTTVAKCIVVDVGTNGALDSALGSSITIVPTPS